MNMNHSDAHSVELSHLSKPNIIHLHVLFNQILHNKNKFATTITDEWLWLIFISVSLLFSRVFFLSRHVHSNNQVSIQLICNVFNFYSTKLR